MERTIYSKYSNERAERFRIRTDIVTDEAGEKKVYKYACTIQAGDHIRRQEELGKQLDAAYAGSRITFCPRTTLLLLTSYAAAEKRGGRIRRVSIY